MIPGLILQPGDRRQKKRLCTMHRRTKYIVRTVSCQVGAPIGLYNLGQTCYMSVVLQAIAHDPLMKNYFVGERHDTKLCPINQCIACALTKSLKKMLTTTNKRGYAPVDFLSSSWHNGSVLFHFVVFQNA